MDGDKFDQSHRASERNPRLSSALRRGSHAPDMKSFSRAVLPCKTHRCARLLGLELADTPQSVAWPVSPISFPTHSHQRTPSPICLAPKALSYYPHPFVSLPSRGQPLLSIPRELARKSCSGSPELIVQLFLYPPRSTQRILRHYPTSTGTCVIELRSTVLWRTLPCPMGSSLLPRNASIWPSRTCWTPYPMSPR